MEDLAFFLELLEVIKIFFNYENGGGGGRFGEKAYLSAYMLNLL